MNRRMSKRSRTSSGRRLGRRTFLGGAGVALALPFLPSLVREPLRAGAQGEVCEAPRRFVGIFAPNGMHMPLWTPRTTGRDYELSNILSPLRDVKDDVLVLSGLANYPGRPDGEGVHSSATGAFMTCAHANKSATALRTGISADQIVAQAYGDCTKLPSLQLGMREPQNTGDCDNGYGCAYKHYISWSTPTTPLPQIVTPRAVFDRLFAGFDPNATVEEIMRRKTQRTSILDAVREDIARVERRVGTRDGEKLDEYLTGVRALERRIEREDAGQPVCELPEPPSMDTYPVDERLDLMMEMIVLAFRCDITRVASLVFGYSTINRQYPFIGVNRDHHTLSHHQNDPDNISKLVTIERWEIAQYAKLVQRLRDAEDFDGNPILRNTAVFLSSEIGDGNQHTHDNLPVLVAGQAGGVLDTGRHIRYDGNPPTANLFISIFQALGIDIDRFGDDGTGPLPGLV